MMSMPISPNAGNVGTGNRLGTSATLPTSTISRSNARTIAASADPSAIATTIPMAPSLVRRSTRINTIVEAPTSTVQTSIRQGWKIVSIALVTRLPAPES